MDTRDTIDWIDLGRFSPQEPLTSDPGVNIKELTTLSWIPDFQISDVQMSGFEAQVSDAGSGLGCGLRSRIRARVSTGSGLVSVRVLGSCQYGSWALAPEPGPS